MEQVINKIEQKKDGAESYLEDNFDDGEEVMGEEPQIQFYNYEDESASLE